MTTILNKSNQLMEYKQDSYFYFLETLNTKFNCYELTNVD